MKRIFSGIAAVLMLLTVPFPAAGSADYDDVCGIQSDSSESDTELPGGWQLWHSYSSYEALDSKLYLHTPDGSTKEISGDFIHAMNGSFGIAPDRITFMAIDPQADEWDIFVSDGGRIKNLTQNSGFRNEDPKWSPDGRSIVFKRGRWDNAADDFIYNLALLDTAAGTVTMLTDDSTEEAMPCFSADGTGIYYAGYSDGIGSIMRLDLNTHQTETIYAEKDVTAYYPVVRNTELYFTKWHHAETRRDQIMCLEEGMLHSLPFNSEQYDCSDPCPLTQTEMIYSSTKDGGYDLYYYDGTRSVLLRALSSGQNDLGADFYPVSAGDVNTDGVVGIADAVLLQKWLLSVPDTVLHDRKAADLDTNGTLNACDLCLMKQKILGLRG